jgi:hypothetical protein
MRDSTGFDLHTIVVKSMDQARCEEMMALCKHFVEHSEKESQSLMKPYVAQVMQLPIGGHELLVTEAPEPWTRPYIRQ